VVNILELLNAQSEGTRSLIFTTVLIWSIFWKGLALWHSARNKQKYWFIFLLVINTVGILEIIFLVFFRKDRKSKLNFLNKKNNTITKQKKK